MADYKLVNIVDSQLEDIASEITLPVITGAQASTYTQFNAQSASSTTQIQFQVQVPSLATAVNRHVLVQSTVDFLITFQGLDTVDQWAANAVLFNYGKTNALQAFPLNSLLTTMQANINDINVSITSREILSAMLKMYNYEELAKYNSLTPSLVDSFYQLYADGTNSNNNVLGNYGVGGFAKEYQPRGCFPVALYSVNADGTANALLNDLQVTASAAGTANYSRVILRCTVTEPLVGLSPFLSGCSKNVGAFLGINTLNLTLNLGNANRAMSNASYAVTGAGAAGGGGVTLPTISSVQFVKADSSKLLMNFLTIPPSLGAKIEPKNVVNYNQYMSYNYNTGQTIAPQTKTSLNFSNVQLGSVPSKILIYARKPDSSLTTYDSNFFLVINKISLNFANLPGILSSASQVDLYNISTKNGLQETFFEFSGRGVSNNAAGAPTTVATTGSILVLDPAIDLGLTEDVTNMSNGQFSINFSIDVENQTAEAITPVIYMVAVNAGLFKTEQGLSSTFLGLLKKTQVLETRAEPAVMDKMTYESDIVGGSIENINCLHKHMKMNFHKATEKEHNFDHAPGETVMGHDAHAMSAGVMAAGVMCAGGKMKPRKKNIHKFVQ